MPLSVQQFLDHAQSSSIIDVRSEGEYAHGHIIGAVNIPLFNNAERALVGTCYKQRGKDAAVLLGLEIVGPKLANFVREVKKIAKNKNVLVHCWRGGMRSGSFAWLLKTAGMQVDILAGGYKAYRTHVQDSFDSLKSILILGGSTGSGKTEVLRELKTKGEQVIDLEGLANHKGSAFGALGQADQPSTELFENLLYEEIRKLNPNQRVWLEDESRRIGKVYLDQRLWNLMEKAPVIALNVGIEHRIQYLVRDYGSFDYEQLRPSIDRIEKRLGGQHYKEALEALAIGDMATVAQILLVYYDKAYSYGLSQNIIPPLVVNSNSIDPIKNADLVLAMANQNQV
jgi:tRNA 2-selenouridine synthase